MDTQLMIEYYSQMITMALYLKPLSAHSRMVYPNGKSISRKDIKRLFEVWLNKYSDRFDPEMAQKFENNLENGMNSDNFTDQTEELFSKFIKSK